jgi:hypothetical protein
MSHGFDRAIEDLRRGDSIETHAPGERMERGAVKPLSEYALDALRSGSR